MIRSSVQVRKCRSRKARVKAFGNLASRVRAVCKAGGALRLIQSCTPDVFFGGYELLPRTYGLRFGCFGCGCDAKGGVRLPGKAIYARAIAASPGPGRKTAQAENENGRATAGDKSTKAGGRFFLGEPADEERN